MRRIAAGAYCERRSSERGGHLLERRLKRRRIRRIEIERRVGARRGVEIGRYVLLEQKLESVAVETADLVAQTNTVAITTADLDNIFTAISQIILPFTMGTNGKVIVTSVGQSNGGPITVNWQRAGGGTGTSHLGSVGGAATLPANFIVRDGEAVIVSEVFCYQPMFAANLVP